MESITEYLHVTHEIVASYEMTPPHAPREDTPIYKQAHHALIVEEDSPCAICGVRKSTLSDVACNPAGATELETHHYPIERSLMNACDIAKVQKVYPQVTDQASFEAFIDSKANLMVLCDVHHRSVKYGIHHLLVQDFAILPFLKDGYVIAATEETVAEAMKTDEAIEGESGSR